MAHRLQTLAPSQGACGIIPLPRAQECVQRAGGPPGGRLSEIDIPLPIAKNISDAELLRIIKEPRD